MMDEMPDNLPRLTLCEDNILTRLLRDSQHLLMQNPQATQAIVQAFVAEGRRFVETPDGQAWKAILARSELVRRGRLIWESYGLDEMIEAEPALLPSAWLDMIEMATSNPDLETILSKLIMEEVRLGTIGAP
jgi:hypothetical protein